MNCLRNMCGVTRRDRVRNEEVRERVGVDIALADRVEERVLSLFGHVERMTKRVYESNMGGVRGRGRPPKGCLTGVRDAVEKRGMTVENARMVCQNRNEWRAIVYGGGIFLLTRPDGRECGNQPYYE